MPERGRPEDRAEDWSADQDAQLRSAFGTLRRDVDAAGLPDARFVLRRAEARRRRRATIAVATGVAAVVGLSYAGFQQLSGQDLTVPPATRTAPDSATSDPDDRPPTDGATTPPEQQTTPPTQQTSSPADATDADPVAPEDLLASQAEQPDTALFVPPALWASEPFTEGQATEAALGARADSALFVCDPDTVMWGAPDEGVWAVMGIRSAEAPEVDGGLPSGFFGAQRVRVLDSPDAAAAHVQEVSAAAAGCQAPAEDTDTDVVVEPLAAEGAYRLTTEFADGTDPLVQFLHVFQHEGTPEAVSTIILTDGSGQVSDAAALEELQRLAGITRQV